MSVQYESGGGLRFVRRYAADCYFSFLGERRRASANIIRAGLSAMELRPQDMKELGQ